MVEKKVAPPRRAPQRPAKKQAAEVQSRPCLHYVVVPELDARERISQLELEVSLLRQRLADEEGRAITVGSLGLRPRHALWAADSIGVCLEPVRDYLVPEGQLGALLSAYEQRVSGWADTPGCSRCGTVERPRIARGLCRRCYEQQRREEGRK